MPLLELLPLPLTTKEDARLYLEACAEEDPGDGSLIRAALNDIAGLAT